MTSNLDRDRDLIRSNPDLKNMIAHSPNSLIFSQQNGHYLNGNSNSSSGSSSINSTNKLGQSAEQSNMKYDYYNNSNSFKNDITNLSNNLSLNLSIHTAEEFGIEMLEWLNNESNNTNNSKSHHLNSDLKLANNATLV